LHSHARIHSSLQIRSQEALDAKADSVLPCFAVGQPRPRSLAASSGLRLLVTGESQKDRTRTCRRAYTRHTGVAHCFSWRSGERSALHHGRINIFPAKTKPASLRIILASLSSLHETFLLENSLYVLRGGFPAHVCTMRYVLMYLLSYTRRSPGSLRWTSADVSFRLTDDVTGIETNLMLTRFNNVRGVRPRAIRRPL